VSGVTVSANGLTLNVAATVGSGGLSTTCQVTVSGAGTVPGSCSGIAVSVPTYNTSYNVTFTATNPDGNASGNGSGKSGLKVLIADATDAFGTCAQYPPPYCGPNSHMEPQPRFVKGAGSPVSQGTQELAGCWTTGGVDQGNVPPYNQGSNIWIYMPGAGYMSNLWFPSPNSVTAGLPQASTC
jgi:hypothetical protein